MHFSHLSLNLNLWVDQSGREIKFSDDLKKFTAQRHLIAKKIIFFIFSFSSLNCNL